MPSCKALCLKRPWPWKTREATAANGEGHYKGSSSMSQWTTERMRSCQGCLQTELKILLPTTGRCLGWANFQVIKQTCCQTLR